MVSSKTCIDANYINSKLLLSVFYCCNTNTHIINVTQYTPTDFKWKIIYTKKGVHACKILIATNAALL